MFLDDDFASTCSCKRCFLLKIVLDFHKKCLFPYDHVRNPFVSRKSVLFLCLTEGKRNRISNLSYLYKTLH